MSEDMATPLCGLVLAGGRSSRMGYDKASLIHPDGRTLGKRCYDLLEQAGCAEVYLSLRSDQEIPDGFSGSEPMVLRDPTGESSGPISGILAAQRARPDADWLVVACDLPRLDLETLRHLLSARRSGEMFLAYRSEFDGLPEPLCAWYAKGSKEIVGSAETACPRKILIWNDCRMLEPATLGALANANTREEWEASLKGGMREFRVLYFGILAERRGMAEELVTSDAATGAALYQELNSIHHFGLSVEHFRVAVNDEFAGWEDMISENDRIAFLPPMSGG